MIDARVDPDFAALERSEARRSAGPSANVPPPAVRPRPTLVSLPAAPAVPAASGELAEADGQAVAAVPPSRPEPVDATVSLQHARLGFAAVAVLVLFWLWVRQRRAG